MFGSYSRFHETQGHFSAGFLAGIVITPIMTPVEKSKIDFQMSPKMTLRDIKYNTLFKGFQATLIGNRSQLVFILDTITIVRMPNILADPLMSCFLVG